MEKSTLCLSVTDTAHELGVSRPVIYELLARDDFPKVRIGRRWIIPRGPLEEWIRARAEEGNDVLA